MKYRFLLITFLFLAFVSTNAAQTTQFTYQGQLQNSSAPANGSFDFEFALFDGLSGGLQLGPILTRTGVAVTGGVFTVPLDFGFVFAGPDRFLEIRVRTAGGGGFTPLTPRQKVGSSPYAIRSVSAASATEALIAATAENALALGGVAANQFVVTTDTRMADARPPTAGSANYVQNSASLQASSNFNVSGTGSASIFNAATQFNINGNRVLSTPGLFNTFAGVNAGAGLGLGANNAFFGRHSGILSTDGNGNSFFGSSAGSSNTTGSLNTLIGSSANVSVGNLFNASAIGSYASVSQSNSMILGSINGINGATNNTNIGIGTTAPTTRLNVDGGTDAELSGGGYIVSGAVSGSNIVIDNNEIMARDNGAISTLFLNADGGDVSLVQNGSGNVGIAIAGTPQDKLHVDGIIRVTTLGTAGSTAICRNASNQISTCSSSLKYKTNFSSYRTGLDLVNKLKPIAFDWKQGGMHDLGLGAEDVAAIEPLLVTYNTKGEVEGVKYDRVGVVLINAVKEQQAQIERQQTVIDELRKTNQAFQDALCELKPSLQICKPKEN